MSQLISNEREQHFIEPVRNSLFQSART